MKISEKAALAMAGYTKAEIEAMDKPAQPAPAAVQNPAIPQQVPPLAAQPAMQIAPQPVQQPTPQQETPAASVEPVPVDPMPDAVGPAMQPTPEMASPAPMPTKPSSCQAKALPSSTFVHMARSSPTAAFRPSMPSG